MTESDPWGHREGGFFCLVLGHLWKASRVCERERVKLLSHVQLLETPWTAAYQSLPSMGFSRQGYWSGLPFPSPGDLPDSGIEPRSLALQADTLPSEPPGKPQESILFDYQN